MSNRGEGGGGRRQGDRGEGRWRSGGREMRNSAGALCEKNVVFCFVLILGGKCHMYR